MPWSACRVRSAIWAGVSSPKFSPNMADMLPVDEHGNEERYNVREM